MQFTSASFIYLFLPAALVGFYAAGTLGRQVYPKAILLAASLVFYGAVNAMYVPLLAGSVVVNYYLAAGLATAGSDRRIRFAAGVAFNLVVLGYFKYFNFFVDNVNTLLASPFAIGAMILPLGISFYTFRQISYLCDVHHGKTSPQDATLLDHALFVGMFPHLLAGPITSYNELIPQLRDRTFGVLKNANLVIGMGMFFIGLFKKVVIADGLSVYSTAVFSASEYAEPVEFAAAWSGAVAYTFQLYFDFSGYSDMAIGLGRMFGLKLPANFYSPLKATSIIDFWRRWHITLGRFITAEVFLPMNLAFARAASGWNLGRLGAFLIASALPTLITFVLVGLWHGAGWTFVIFGVMHGLYMVVNQGWRKLLTKRQASMVPSSIAWAITFVALIFSLAVFGAPTLTAALRLVAAMCSPNVNAIEMGFAGLLSSPSRIADWVLFHKWGYEQYLVLAFVIALTTPNVAQLMSKYSPCLVSRDLRASSISSPLTWRANHVGMAFLLVVSLVALLNISASSAFLYFQF